VVRDVLAPVAGGLPAEAAAGGVPGRPGRGPGPRGPACPSTCAAPPLGAGSPGGTPWALPVTPGATPGSAPPSGASAAPGCFAVLAAGVLGMHLARGGIVRERVARLAGLVHAPVCLPG
jgi:hypothetical protein